MKRFICLLCLCFILSCVVVGCKDQPCPKYSEGEVVQHILTKNHVQIIWIQQNPISYGCNVVTQSEQIPYHLLGSGGEIKVLNYKFDIFREFELEPLSN